jgi:hypothetical protein
MEVCFHNSPKFLELQLCRHHRHYYHHLHEQYPIRLKTAIGPAFLKAPGSFHLNHILFNAFLGIVFVFNLNDRNRFLNVYSRRCFAIVCGFLTVSGLTTDLATDFFQSAHIFSSFCKISVLLQHSPTISRTARSAQLYLLPFLIVRLHVRPVFHSFCNCVFHNMTKLVFVVNTVILLLQ